jgi:hypothetical protein
MPDGSLYALIYTGGPREPHDSNVMLGTRSIDDGETWSPAEPSDIPAVASKVVLLKHEDSVLMLFNPPPASAGNDGLGQRCELALWVNRDGCRTWKKKRTIARVVPRPEQPSWKAVCYPDGFIDAKRQRL